MMRKMKVALTAQGKDRTSQVDPHFARARYFLVVDIDNDALAVRSNECSRHTPHLAGTQANLLPLAGQMSGHCPRHRLSRGDDGAATIGRSEE